MPCVNRIGPALILSDRPVPSCPVRVSLPTRASGAFSYLVETPTWLAPGATSGFPNQDAFGRERDRRTSPPPCEQDNVSQARWQQPAVTSSRSLSTAPHPSGLPTGGRTPTVRDNPPNPGAGSSGRTPSYTRRREPITEMLDSCRVEERDAAGESQRPCAGSGKGEGGGKERVSAVRGRNELALHLSPQIHHHSIASGALGPSRPRHPRRRPIPDKLCRFGHGERSASQRSHVLLME